MINTRSGMKEERYFCFKVFSYTSADHKRRFERCPYSKEEYAARRESAFAVKEAFATGSVQKLNALAEKPDGHVFGGGLEKQKDDKTEKLCMAQIGG